MLDITADIDYCINMLESLKGIEDDKESLELTIKLFEKRFIKIKQSLDIDIDTFITNKENELAKALKPKDINSYEERKQNAREFINAFKNQDDGLIDFGENLSEDISQENLNIRADANGNFYESFPGTIVDNTPTGKIKKF